MSAAARRSQFLEASPSVEPQRLHASARLELGEVPNGAQIAVRGHLVITVAGGALHVRSERAAVQSLFTVRLPTVMRRRESREWRFDFLRLNENDPRRDR